MDSKLLKPPQQQKQKVFFVLCTCSKLFGTFPHEKNGACSENRDAVRFLLLSRLKFCKLNKFPNFSSPQHTKPI